MEIETNREKIFWPQQGYTKGDLLDYYKTISHYLLPFLKDRPEVMHRFPNGIESESFFQKQAPTPLPEWMKTIEIQHTDKKVNYLLIQDLKSLLYVVNLGCIELHPFNSRYKKVGYPDFIVLDLDPEAIAFKHVVEVAQAAHEFLDEINIPNYCKTSGKRGLHIYIPMGSKYNFDQAEKFAKLLATLIHHKVPKITSLERMPKNRQGKVYIDYLQNNPSKTIVAPYSVRPIPQAPVATPLKWEEVKSGLDPLDFTIKNIPQRLDKLGDIFLKQMLKEKINLEKCLENIEEIGL